MINQKMTLEFNLEDYDSQKQAEKSLKVQEICNRLLDFERALQEGSDNGEGLLADRIRLLLEEGECEVGEVMYAFQQFYFICTGSVRDLIED